MNNDISVVDLNQKLSLFSEKWEPKIVAECNDSYAKVVKFLGSYVWHKHEEDELFLILSGKLEIKLEGYSLFLQQGEMVVIPKGIMHCPVADQECHVLLIEPKSVISTGDAQECNDKKATSGEWI